MEESRSSMEGLHTMTADIPTPRFHAKKVVKPIMEDNMYRMTHLGFDDGDVKDRIENVLGPLSIFAPFPHEDEPEHIELELERPVTPIDKEIKTQPKSFDQLANYVRRRLAARPDLPHLSIDDQQNLAGVIIGEVNCIWPDIRKQIDDPFLTPTENKELNRRIAVYIVTVCSQLFSHYLDKAHVLNSRGVFSGPANMCRLKTQLSIEVNKFLNILTIRRYIVADIRGHKETDSTMSDDFYMPAPKGKRPAEFSYQNLIESSRPKSKVKKIRPQTCRHDIKEMARIMPTLDTSKLMDLVAQLPDRALSVLSTDGSISSAHFAQKFSQISRQSKMEASMEKVLLKRSGSDPCLHQGETLLEEMGINTNVRIDMYDKYELDYLLRERQLIAKMKDSYDDQPVMGSREYAEADLKRLMEQTEVTNDDVEEYLPPLLQAIVRNARHDGLKKRMEIKLVELEEKKKLRDEQGFVSVREPTHLQPDTVNRRVNKKITVRTSDIRVSERVCMSSMTLQRYGTVYNDLLEEVDPNTVKAMDKSLFFSEEIKEVYEEIMKTVPHDHLDLENDPMFVPTIGNIPLSGLMTSSRLAKKPSDRIINPLLKGWGSEAPWGDEDAREWAKTPQERPRNYRGAMNFGAIAPDPAQFNAVLNKSSKDLPDFQKDNLARSYASWLEWWKSTVTTDDYMKYLSTQETDFMGVLFHFYDSGDEDEDFDDETGRTSTHISRTASRRGAKKPSRGTMISRERDRKLLSMKSQKTEYKEGFWNVNTVLMGGLGKEPVLDADEIADIKGQFPVSEEHVVVARTLQERAAQAKLVRLGPDQKRHLSEVSMGISTLGEPERQLSPQERLERVWALLHMTDSMKLDMAIKYSCNEHYMQLEEAIEKWEYAVDLIIEREKLLMKLEKFERTASDPNRFFEKGVKGSFASRLAEARERSILYKHIDTLDEDIRGVMDYVKEKFHDEITYKGRPYTAKIKWDRVEMLFWLQEERKQQAIQFESIARQLPLRHAQLEPLQLRTK